jgi:hypothetical protein
MMTNEQLKEIACEVIDMNGGEFSYRFGYFLHGGRIQLTCWVTHIESDLWEYPGSIEDPEKLIRLIHDATDRISKNLQVLKLEKISRLKEELAKLEEE